MFDPANVQALLAKDHYTSLLLHDDELLADESLEQLSRRFGAQQFVRVHRSAIIDLTALRELVHVGDRRYMAVLLDRTGTRIPTSRDRLGTLKAVLGLA